MTNPRFFDPTSPSLGIRCIGPFAAIGFALGALIGAMVGNVFFGQIFGLVVGSGLGSVLFLLIKSRARGGDQE